jgi:hypothetical protein
MATKNHWRIPPETKRAIAKFAAENRFSLRRYEIAQVKGIGRVELWRIIREYGAEFGLTLKETDGRSRGKTRRATA